MKKKKSIETGCESGPHVNLHTMIVPVIFVFLKNYLQSIKHI